MPWGVEVENAPSTEALQQMLDSGKALEDVGVKWERAKPIICEVLKWRSKYEWRRCCGGHWLGCKCECGCHAVVQAVQPWPNEPAGKPVFGPLTRDSLGEIVRNAWVKRCALKPNPRPDHLEPYSTLSEFDKETDRAIGEAVVNAVCAHIGEACIVTAFKAATIAICLGGFVGFAFAVATLIFLKG